LARHGERRLSKPDNNRTTKGMHMRKFILVAAIALTSTAAYAGPSRSLSLASADPNQTVTEQKPQAKEVAQPPVTNPPQQTQAKTPVIEDKATPVSRPRRKSATTEARIIYELHRHGIYW
jgi:hypothetical protein